MNKEVKTNLRWAGGKSKMLKILEEFFPKEIDKYIETFTGGGSVMLHILQNYSPNVVYANDIDEMLINYYNSIKHNPQQVIDDCLELKNNHDNESFAEKFKTLDRNIASHFFASNKASFSGLNKTYSAQAFDKNFTLNSINKIKDVSEIIQNVNFINDNFTNLDNIVGEIDGYFIYLDPPYYGNKDKGLYGDKGKLHKEFNHMELFEWVEKHSLKNKIMISYDDSPFIRELYKDYNIYSFDFVYSMTNTGGNSCKNGKEIVITNYDIE